MEILDHFACKVEEVLAAHPGCTLDVAMDRAHDSFGVMGFYPVAKHCEEAVMLKYKKIFRKQLKELFSSFPSLLLFAATGFASYKIAVWEYLHKIFLLWGCDFTFFIILLSFLAVTIVTHRSIYVKKNLIARTMYSINNSWYFLLTYQLFRLTEPTSKNIHVWAIILACFFVAMLARQIAAYSTVKVGAAEITDFENNYKTVLG